MGLNDETIEKIRKELLKDHLLEVERELKYQRKRQIFWAIVAAIMLIWLAISLSMLPGCAEHPGEYGNFEMRRIAVESFADLMEQRLTKNDHKGGWEDDSDKYLIERLEEELLELKQAIIAVETNNSSWMRQILRRNIRNEAADVANFAMMIADNADLEEEN